MVLSFALFALTAAPPALAPCEFKPYGRLGLLWTCTDLVVSIQRTRLPVAEPLRFWVPREMEAVRETEPRLHFGTPSFPSNETAGVEVRLDDTPLKGAFWLAEYVPPDDDEFSEEDERIVGCFEVAGSKRCKSLKPYLTKTSFDQLLSDTEPPLIFLGKRLPAPHVSCTSAAAKDEKGQSRLSCDASELVWASGLPMKALAEKENAYVAQLAKRGASVVRTTPACTLGGKRATCVRLAFTANMALSPVMTHTMTPTNTLTVLIGSLPSEDGTQTLAMCSWSIDARFPASCATVFGLR